MIFRQQPAAPLLHSGVDVHTPLVDSVLVQLKISTESAPHITFMIHVSQVFRSCTNMDYMDNIHSRVVGFEPSATASSHAPLCCPEPATPNSLPESPLAILKHETALPKLRCRTFSLSVGRGVSTMEGAGHRRCKSLGSVTVPRDVPVYQQHMESLLHAKSTPAITIPSSQGCVTVRVLWVPSMMPWGVAMCHSRLV